MFDVISTVLTYPYNIIAGVAALGATTLVLKRFVCLPHLPGNVYSRILGES